MGAVAEFESQYPKKSKNKSLCLFSDDGTIRKWMIKIEESEKFKYGILGLILISSLTLSQENPLVDPDSTFKFVLTVLDAIMTSCFLLEIVIKVIAHGALFNGPKSFLRDFWNCLDFFIVVISIISLVASDIELQIFKILRMGKLIRPLRVLSRNEGLKISIQALVVSIPAMMRLMMIVMLFFVIFAVMGINLLKGRLYSCSLDGVTLSPT